MKRNLLILIMVVAALAGAGNAYAQLRWGATAGININNFKFKQDGILTVDKGISETVGINGEMMFPGIGFGIDIGLRYEQLGASLNLGDFPLWSDYSKDERIYIHNIQIPFNLKFKFTRLQGLEDYVAPFVFGGPLFNIQVAHSKCDAIKFSGGDLGLAVGGGFEIFKRWQISASYTWGMTYALKANILSDYSARNRYWNVRLAYYF